MDGLFFCVGFVQDWEWYIFWTLQILLSLAYVDDICDAR